MGRDYVAELRKMVQTKCKRSVAAKDIEYELQEVEGKPFAVVFLHAVDSHAFVGEPADSEAQAKHLAAKQALEDRHEWAPGLEWVDPATVPAAPKKQKLPAKSKAAAAPPGQFLAAGGLAGAGSVKGGKGAVMLKRPNLLLKQRLMPLTKKAATLVAGGALHKLTRPSESTVKASAAARLAAAGAAAGAAGGSAGGKGAKGIINPLGKGVPVASDGAAAEASVRLQLNKLLAEQLGRPAKQEDYQFEVLKVADGKLFQATLTLPFGVGFTGAPMPKVKQARNSAIAQAVLHKAGSAAGAARPKGGPLKGAVRPPVAAVVAGWGSGGVVAGGKGKLTAPAAATKGKLTAPAAAAPQGKGKLTAPAATAPAAAPQGGDVDSKHQLSQLLQRTLGRPHTKEDVGYDTQRVGDGTLFQSTLYLRCVSEDLAFIGEAASNAKQAERAAAKQAVVHSRTWAADAAQATAPGQQKVGAVKPPQQQQQPQPQPLQKQKQKQQQQQKGGALAPMQPAMPPPGKGQVQPPGGGGGVVTKLEKPAGMIETRPAAQPEEGFNFKTALTTFLQRTYRQTLNKDDVAYQCERVGEEGRLIQATLSLSLLDGLAFIGEARVTEKQAQQAAAEQALLSSGQWCKEGAWQDPRKGQQAATSQRPQQQAQRPKGAGKGLPTPPAVPMQRPVQPATPPPMKRAALAAPAQSAPAAKRPRPAMNGAGVAGKAGPAGKGLPFGSVGRAGGSITMPARVGGAAPAFGGKAFGKGGAAICGGGFGGKGGKGVTAPMSQGPWSGAPAWRR